MRVQKSKMLLSDFSKEDDCLRDVRKKQNQGKNKLEMQLLPEIKEESNVTRRTPKEKKGGRNSLLEMPTSFFIFCHTFSTQKCLVLSVLYICGCSMDAFSVNVFFVSFEDYQQGRNKNVSHKNITFSDWSVTVHIYTCMYYYGHFRKNIIFLMILQIWCMTQFQAVE